MNRRQARVKAVQSLFQVDMSGTDSEEAVQNVLEENETADAFLTTLVRGVIAHTNDVDDAIKQQLQHWSMDRIGNVDRQVLRMAVYELFYMAEIPRKVTLDEAVEVGKLFGGEESGRFVNGVLSTIAKKRSTEDTD